MTTSDSTLRVLSWNIRKAFGTDWRRDPGRVIALLADQTADIVLLQEADHRRAPRHPALPPAALAVIGLNPLPVDTAGLGWHGNALLYGPDIVPVEIHALDLPGLEPRGALIADLATPAGMFRVGSLHLGLTRRARRMQQARIVAHLDTLTGAPTLLAGDWNEWSTRRGLEPLARIFQIHAPGPTFHSRMPESRSTGWLRVRVCGSTTSQSSIPPRSDLRRITYRLWRRSPLGNAAFLNAPLQATVFQDPRLGNRSWRLCAAELDRTSEQGPPFRSGNVQTEERQHREKCQNQAEQQTVSREPLLRCFRGAGDPDFEPPHSQERQQDDRAARYQQCGLRPDCAELGCSRAIPTPNPVTAIAVRIHARKVRSLAEWS